MGRRATGARDEGGKRFDKKRRGEEDRKATKITFDGVLGGWSGDSLSIQAKTPPAARPVWAMLPQIHSKTLKTTFLPPSPPPYRAILRKETMDPLDRCHLPVALPCLIPHPATYK